MDISQLNRSTKHLSVLQKLGIDAKDERLNPNGGAMHWVIPPRKCQGTRIARTAARITEKNKKYALCTLCIGVGQGYANDH